MVLAVSIWLRLTGFLGLCDFLLIGPAMLSDDLALWRWLLVRDNQSTIGSLVNVIFLGMALRKHGETKTKGQTGRKIHSCPSVRVGDLLVYFSMVYFNSGGDTGFIK